MSSYQQTKSPRYSAPYEDDVYQYRHIILDKSMVGLIPKNRLMDECEWRALGIKQGPNWEHYLIHKPEPFVLMFRRLLKYRMEPDPTLQQQNTHFPTARIPISALNDSTNMMMRRGAVKMAINPSKTANNSLNESGFESHCEN